jgi:undecaprenyl-diphosphatase
MPLWPDAVRWSEALSWDQRLAHCMHRWVDTQAHRAFWIACSRLGDATSCLALLLVWPWVGGADGARVAGWMFLLGTVNLSIYWTVKRITRRLRSYVHCPGIQPWGKVHDTFSFPSGHTLHAVAFAILLSDFYPAWQVELMFFSLLVGSSRVVLGLHYPSDVIMGALIGLGTATWVLQL